jgi:hypothetical protein
MQHGECLHATNELKLGLNGVDLVKKRTRSRIDLEYVRLLACIRQNKSLNTLLQFSAKLSCSLVGQKERSDAVNLGSLVKSRTEQTPVCVNVELWGRLTVTCGSVK